jgi:hypothetical protein
MIRLSLALAAILMTAGPALCQEAGPGGWTVDIGAVDCVRPTELGSQHDIEGSAPSLESTYGDHLTVATLGVTVHRLQTAVWTIR